MTDETKTPTAQDIDDASCFLIAGFHAEGSPRTPAAMRAGADRLDRLLGVLAFARMALPPGEREVPVPWAEEEGELVLGGIAEHYGVGPEVEGAAGTPVWREEGGEFRAYVGGPVHDGQILFACDACWVRFPDGAGVRPEGGGILAGLPANLRAATASWNAAHPDLPPVVVPEQFREIEDVPEVEAPEDAGGDGPDDDGWIAWAGGECPVPAGAVVEVGLRDGYAATHEATGLYWSHIGGAGDIVRYRIVPENKPEQTPEQRVADEEVEALVTGAVS